jgi:hypothetical protein
MRRSLLSIALVAAVAMPVIFTATARAASGGSCAVDAKVSITPGISLTPSKGKVAGTGGTIACVGQFKGAKVAGPGKLTVTGTYGTGATAALQHGDTCGQGSGAGTLTAVLPKVSGGTVRVLGSFTFVRVGANVEVNGKIGTATFAGTLAFGPPPGQTCATVKVTSATVAGSVALGG